MFKISFLMGKWLKPLWLKGCLTRVDLFVLDLVLFFVVTLADDGKDSQMGSPGQERKKLAAAEEAVPVAVKSLDESLEASAQGEKRLEELQSQERSPFAGPVADAEADLVRLQAQVAELQGSTRAVERHARGSVQQRCLA